MPTPHQGQHTPVHTHPRLEPSVPAGGLSSVLTTRTPRHTGAGEQRTPWRSHTHHTRRHSLPQATACSVYLTCLLLNFHICHRAPAHLLKSGSPRTARGAWDVGRNSRLSQEFLGGLIQQGHGHQAPLWGARGGGVQGVGGSKRRLAMGLVRSEGQTRVSHLATA